MAWWHRGNEVRGGAQLPHKMLCENLDNCWDFIDKDVKSCNVLLFLFFVVGSPLPELTKKK